MNIPQINFNFIPQKPQNRVNTSLRMKNGLQADTVSFTSFLGETQGEKMKNLVPQHKGIIYKKVTNEKGNVTDKIPTEVDIVKKSPRVFQFEKDGEVIGHVELSYVPEYECGEDVPCPLYRDYKEEGIKGARLEVDFLKNKKPEEYGGIGHLADLIEVDACKKLGIKPNIISYSFDDVAPLHYLRGKRFVPYERYVTSAENNEYKLNGENPNDVVKKIVESTPKNGDFDTSSIKTPFLIMYMPKVQVQELEEELKEHPIF